MTLAVGQVLDQKYRIVRILGQGAMGAVFEGENVRIHRKVAIKVLHGEIANRKDLVDRFEREAQAAGRIGSEHIVDILDLGELPDGARFMVMEYLDGESLGARIKSCGRMLPQQLLPLLRQLLVGLGAAHQAGIVHRDLKPDNIFLAREVAGHRDFVKILDFGVSKFSALNTEEARMTQTGAVMGTPYYMSPEQAKGSRDVDHRSDLFSVGVIFYEAITGRVPFDGETFNELMFKIALQDPPPPETLVPGLDAGIGRMIRKALAREPAQRFSDAAAFVAAIDEWLTHGKASISVPPPENVALAAPKMPATVALQASTQAEWSNSGAPAVKPKSTPWAALAIGAVVVLGGGGFAATQLLGSKKAEGSTAAVPSSTATSSDEVSPAPSATPASTAIATEVPPASEPSATPSASAAPTATASAEPTSGPRVSAKSPGTTAKTTTPTAATPPPPPPPPAATPAGRRPREDL